jgi:uncharacterized protein YfcZ (UPF0381/DUF406 family)
MSNDKMNVLLGETRRISPMLDWCWVGEGENVEEPFVAATIAIPESVAMYQVHFHREFLGLICDNCRKDFNPAVCNPTNAREALGCGAKTEEEQQACVMPPIVPNYAQTEKLVARFWSDFAQVESDPCDNVEGALTNLNEKLNRIALGLDAWEDAVEVAEQKAADEAALRALVAKRG